MNQTPHSRSILIIIMLSLAFLAAVTFFVQARQRLSTQVAELTGTRQALAEELSDTAEQLTTIEGLAAARATESADLSTQVTELTAQVPTYEAQITSFQQEVATLTVQLGESRADVGRLQTEQDTLHALPPDVRLISPTDGATFEPGDAIPIIVSASDAYGLAAVNVTLDDTTLASLSLQDNEPLITVYQVWTPPSDGTYTIGVMAVDIDGTASPLITSTFTVVNIAQMNADIRTQIEGNVVEIRGLTPLQAIEPTLLSPEDLRAELEADLSEGVTPAEALSDVLVLNAFDFVPRDFDYLGFTLDLYSEQVAGFYDPETSRFVVISDDNLLSVAEQLTHAHEFTHALQDQYFDLSTLGDTEITGDASLAFRALAEGDATLVEYLYAFQYLDADQLQTLLNESSAIDTEVLDSAPPVLANLLMFPYLEGLNFVQALVSEGDWELVDEAWANPPVSTEQILHPSRYLAGDEPETVTVESLLETLGADWELLDEDVLGEFFLREYLAQQVDDATANAAAEGWGGDRYAVYWDDRQELMVMVLRSTWDTADDATEFAAAYSDYASQRYNTTAVVQGDLTCWAGVVDGISDTTCLYEVEGELFIVRAPNRAVVDAIVNLHYPATVPVLPSS
jgi:prefoldin subunit 5